MPSDLAAEPLDSILDSMDLGNAMRLISQQGAIPHAPFTSSALEPSATRTTLSPRQSMHSGSSARPSDGIAEYRTQPFHEPFVARAPPPITLPATSSASSPPHAPISPYSTVSTRHSKRQRKESLGHIPFTHPVRDSSSSSTSSSAVSLAVSPHPSPLRQTEVLGRVSRDTQESRDAGMMDDSRGRAKLALNAVQPMPNGGELATGTKRKSHRVSRLFSLTHRKDRHANVTSHHEANSVDPAAEKLAFERAALAKARGKRFAQSIMFCLLTPWFGTDRVQDVVSQLPLHPNAERSANEARTYLQAYYDHLYHAAHVKADQSHLSYLRYNPLKVIRWRREVVVEEKRRTAWLGSASELVGQDDQGSNRNGLRSQAKPSHDAPTLFSAERLLQAQRQGRHAWRGAAPHEWLVCPAEMTAYLDCKGVVTRFVPSSDAPLRRAASANLSQRGQGSSSQHRAASLSPRRENPGVIRTSPLLHDSPAAASQVSFRSDQSGTNSIGRSMHDPDPSWYSRRWEATQAAGGGGIPRVISLDEARPEGRTDFRPSHQEQSLGHGDRQGLSAAARQSRQPSHSDGAVNGAGSGAARAAGRLFGQHRHQRHLIRPGDRMALSVRIPHSVRRHNPFHLDHSQRQADSDSEGARPSRSHSVVQSIDFAQEVENHSVANFDGACAATTLDVNLMEPTALDVVTASQSACQEVEDALQNETELKRKYRERDE